MSDLDALDDEFAQFDIPTRRRRPLKHRGERETHCRRGHEMTPGNTIIENRSDGSICRHCKRCRRLLLLCRED